MTQAPARHFWIRHGLLPLLLFVGAQALIEALSLDLVLGDWLFRLEGHDLWTLAISWFSALLLYRWLLQRRPLGHNPRAGRTLLMPVTVAETGAWTPNESAGRRR
ncbi:hypothetical protein [Marinobacterium aestuariivivens]|uniref:Uncharacterized protein n=1 Tax=Marinobacterium aestuariivivens TaxID=1698799 RepID=A0ABW1ZVB9_9GAMM